MRVIERDIADSETSAAAPRVAPAGRVAALSLVAQLAFSGTTLVLAIVTTPFLLSKLGAETFGASRAIVDWLAYLAILELGLGGALAPAINRCAARTHGRALTETLAGGVRVLWPVVGRKLAAGVLLVAFASMLIPVAPERAPALRIAMLVGLAGCFVTLALPFQHLYTALHRRHAVIAFQIVQAVCQTSLAVALAWLGGGIIGQTFAYVAGALALAAMLFIRSPIRPGSVFRLAVAQPASPALRAEVHNLNLPTLLTQLSSQVSFLSDNLVISALVGPAAVSSFFLSQRFLTVACNQLGVVTQATSPRLAQLFFVHDLDALCKRMVDSSKLITMLLAGLLGATALCNKALITLWVGAETYAGDTITLLATLNGCMLVILSAWQMPLVLSGHVRLLAPISAISAVVNVALSLALTYCVGVSGPLWGTTLSLVAIQFIGVPWMMRRAFGVNLWRLAAAILTPAAWASLVFASTWIALGSSRARLGSAAAAAALASCAFAAGCWFVIMSREERAVWTMRIRSALMHEAR